MDLNTFTLAHIFISLLGIVTGLVVLGGWIAGQHHPRLALLFLVTTLATSVTGYFFPFQSLTPAHVVGGISLVVLALAFYALYGGKLLGGWRKTYVITALAALYLNFFVLVAQLFQKTPALRALAPAGTEPPFGITQFAMLGLFCILGTAAVRRFCRAG